MFNIWFHVASADPIFASSPTSLANAKTCLTERSGFGRKILILSSSPLIDPLFYVALISFQSLLLLPELLLSGNSSSVILRTA